MKSLTKNWGRKALFALPLAAIIGGFAYAQIEGPERGIRPLASTGDFEITGIEVNVTGDSPDEARRKGWEEAQRKAWKQLWKKTRGSDTSGLSDGTLNSIVSAVVVEEEQIGPKRYVAKLGVLFDRARAGQILGVKGITRRSAPMLLLPVYHSAGAPIMFEQRTPWQRAWAKYRTFDSRVDYVRPSGAGSESLLLNAGQLERRNRSWLRVIMDEFGAADVIIPIARVERKWPGGPIVGTFTARYGVNNRYIGGFTMTAKDSDGIPKMMDEAVKKIDKIYQDALASGRLKVDARLILEEAVIEEADIDTDESEDSDNKSSDINNNSNNNSDNNDGDSDQGDTDVTAPPPPEATPAVTTTISVQIATPDPESVNRGEGALRSVPGVRAASTSSLALGGTSVIRVVYQGNPAQLRSALQARGWRVSGSGTTLRISR